MKVVNILFVFFVLFSFDVFSEDGSSPNFSDYSTVISSGPFVNKAALTAVQRDFSADWRSLIEKELVKPVNFSGHYRLVITQGGVLSKECGNDGWVCGWVIDKKTGEVVSTLPEFNGNTKYFATIDNGTPSPDSFSIEYYPNSSLVWVSGQNKPENGDFKQTKCANAAYKYNANTFSIVASSRCEIDTGDDEGADKYLP